MLKQLAIKNVKSFSDVTLPLQSFTVLLGTNASGKSNVRDILRFLHGLSRGYKLVELFAGRYEGSDKVWGGVRGGPYGFISYGNKSCEIDVSFNDNDLQYHIAVQEMRNKQIRIMDEWLQDGSIKHFTTRNSNNERPNKKARIARIWLPPGGDHRKGHTEEPLNDEPLIPQAEEYLSERADGIAQESRSHVRWVLSMFSSMRFLDLSPNSMREPTYPGPLALGDAGENLSTVLYNLIYRADRGGDITAWLRELTPLDVAAIEFDKDNRGRLSLVLVENDKTRISLESASDGTLRFLAYLALAFTTSTPTTCFVEEIDNGIHPARLRLLVELLETQTSNGMLQVVASSHSPALLNLLSYDTLMGAQLLYRNEDSVSSKAIQLRDLPDFDRIISRRHPGTLMESGWFENTVEALDYQG
jgi:predicted ATPase